MKAWLHGRLAVLAFIFFAACACKSTAHWGRPASDPIPPKLLATFRHLHANQIFVYPNIPFRLPDATKTWWEYTVTEDGQETIRRVN
jgi:hypothetical protein